MGDVHINETVVKVTSGRGPTVSIAEQVVVVRPQAGETVEITETPVQVNVQSPAVEVQETVVSRVIEVGGILVHGMDYHNTGAPVAIGTVNAEGVSALVPRLDHVHAHEVFASGNLHPEYATPAEAVAAVEAADPLTLSGTLKVNIIDLASGGLLSIGATATNVDISGVRFSDSQMSYASTQLINLNTATGDPTGGILIDTGSTARVKVRVVGYNVLALEGTEGQVVLSVPAEGVLGMDSGLALAGNLVAEGYVRTNSVLWASAGVAGTAIVARYENYDDTLGVSAAAVAAKLSGTEWNAVIWQKEQAWNSGSAASLKDVSAIFNILKDGAQVEVLKLASVSPHVTITGDEKVTGNLIVDTIKDTSLNTQITFPAWSETHINLDLSVGRNISISGKWLGVQALERYWPWDDALTVRGGSSEDQPRFVVRPGTTVAGQWTLAFGPGGSTAVDTFIARPAVGALNLQGALLIGADASPEAGYILELRNPMLTDDYIDMKEITTPGAPGANRARQFTRDNGSGKTQYCVLFPTGAVQVIATEP